MKNVDEINSPSDIFQCYLNEELNCSDCPRHDDDLKTKPYFAFGDLPADVIILGEAPGGNTTGEDNDLRTNKRIWKNYQEIEHIAGESDKLETESFKFDPVWEMGILDYLEPFFERINMRFEEAFGRKCGFYYTNYTKCNDIHDDAPEAHRFSKLPSSAADLNEKGTESCRGYFSKELELADPSAILIFSKGTSHLSRVLSDYGHSVPSGGVTNAVLNKNFDPGESPIRVYEPEDLSVPIIPSYHFRQGIGQLGKEIKKDWIDKTNFGYADAEYEGIKDRYADELGIELVEQVSEVY